MPVAQALEFVACRVFRAPNQCKDRNGAGLVLELNLVNFEPCEFWGLVTGRGAGDDVDAKELRRALEPGGDVDLVADRRIVETERRPQVADAAFSGIPADA